MPLMKVDRITEANGFDEVDDPNIRYPLPFVEILPTPDSPLSSVDSNAEEDEDIIPPLVSVEEFLSCGRYLMMDEDGQRTLGDLAFNPVHRIDWKGSSQLVPEMGLLGNFKATVDIDGIMAFMAVGSAGFALKENLIIYSTPKLAADAVKAKILREFFRDAPLIRAD